MRSEWGLLLAAALAIPLGLLLLADERSSSPPTLQEAPPRPGSSKRRSPPPDSDEREALPPPAPTPSPVPLVRLPLGAPALRSQELSLRERGRATSSLSVTLSVQDIDGFPLEATVWDFDPACPEKGTPLAQGRGEVRVPGPRGRLVRVTAGERVPTVTPLLEGALVLALGRTLEGQVVAQENGVPLRAALVESPSAQGVNVVRTDELGRFQLVVSEGPVDLRVLAPGRPSTRYTVDTESPRLELPLGRGARGRVVRDDGAPVADVELQVIGARQLSRFFRVRSDSEGRFSLPSGLHEDEKVVLVADSQAWLSSRDATWQDPLDELKVVVSRPSEVIIDGPGELTPDHTWPGQAPLAAPERVPGGSRRYSGLASGGYRVVVEGRLAAHLRVGRGVSSTHVSRVAPARRETKFTVRAVDENGRGLVGAEVRIQGAQAEARATSGPQGIATLSLPLEDASEALVLSGSAPGRIHRPGLVDSSSSEAALVFTRAASLDLALSPPLEAEVAVFVNGVSVYRGHTRASGRLYLAGLPAGRVRIAVEAPNGRLVERSVTLPLSDALRLRLQD